MPHDVGAIKRGFVLVACLVTSWVFAAPPASGETTISGKVFTTDGKVVASGAVALEKGELHNSAFVAGGEILSDGTFKIPLPSGGAWGLHVYSEGYIYFPLQVHMKEGVDNEIPVILLLDGATGDDPRISDIRFEKVSDQALRITMKVGDPDDNLGPQMLAIDKKRFKAYRMIPAKGDLSDKKANFPAGTYVSPSIPVPLSGEDLKGWLFVVADHRCSNGPVFDGLNLTVFRPPIPRKESLRCEVPGIWKSNFQKLYRFTSLSPGAFKGEQFEGTTLIDQMGIVGENVTIGFQFKGQNGISALRLVCEDNSVTMKGLFTLPGRSGEWVFTKLKNEKTAPKGKDLFQANCFLCHFDDRSDVKLGPGLKGVFKNPTLPNSGRPTSEKEIRDRIKNGGTKMPPLKHLKEEEISAIIDYLKTL